MNHLLVYDDSVLTDHVGYGPGRPGDMFLLVPLTSSVRISSALRRRLLDGDAKIEMASSGDLLNNAADRVRGKYIEFIAELPDRIQWNSVDLKRLFALDKHVSLWWFSLVAEKNTFKSESFNRLAQMDMLVDLIARGGIQTVWFGCCADPLRDALKEYCRAKRIGFKVLPTRCRQGVKFRFQSVRRLRFLKHLVVLFYQALKFLLRTLLVRRALRGIARTPHSPDALTCVTYYPTIDTVAGREGIFKNKYYVNLQEALESRQKRITWVLMYVGNPFMSLAESLEYARRFLDKGYAMYFLEEFCTLRGQFSALLRMLVSGLRFLRLRKIIRQAHTLNGYNFYPLFADDWYSSFVGTTGFHGIMYYTTFHSLFSRLRVAKCLYPCEMHAWEKALIHARNSVSRSTKLYAYQHGTLSRMLLNYFNAPSEIRTRGALSMAQPDRILCTGQVPFEHLRESGWPEKCLTIVEAIRYSYLRDSLVSAQSQKRNAVLVPLSLSAVEGRALLSAASEAFRDWDGAEIWIKPHPFLGMTGLGVSPNSPGWNPRFQIKLQPIEELLPYVKVAIVGESGVSLESLAFCTKIVLVNVPEFINMSPLRGVKSEMVETISSIEALRKAVESVMNSKWDAAKFHAEARKVVTDYFCLGSGSDLPARFLRVLEQ